ncbi:hypothetical protein BX600DRAFT_468851 [Xylariales sp. PMI_506]|nr:hypothetical protein BX600DRAFT_468851 [Xylariales sp. PMI_506]
MLFSLWSRAFTVGLLAASGVSSVRLDQSAQEMFDQAIAFQDDIYDPDAGYLYYFYYPLAAGPHETRSSIWHATALLQRNHGSDVDEAVKIITNVIGGQEKNSSVLWYGDYTVYPEQPDVGTPFYAPVIYNSWDPNWRGFIGTCLIIIYEEFNHLLSGEVQELILESLYNNTIGDSYRVGGVDDDNLYPAYSNAWLMRTVATSWTGLKWNNTNMTESGDAYANEFFKLFDLNGTLSEFNGPTYAGVSLYALTIAAKYLNATSSVIGQNAVRAIQEIWDYESLLWNANLRNFAGPWDRSYGYDMNKYVAIMDEWIWALTSKKTVWPKQRGPVFTMTHADDFELAPVISVLSGFHKSLLSETVLQRLVEFPGEHTYTGQTYAPPADYEPRNISSWLSANLTIGTDSFNQSVLGGYSKDETSFSPSTVHWLRSDDSVGYFNLYPTQTALQATVVPYELTLTYPLGNASSSFTFVLASNPLGKARNIYGLDDVDGLNITVTGGSVNPVPEVTFCGLVGGTCSIVHNFEFWNLTFVMPEGSTETPSISFKFALE